MRLESTQVIVAAERVRAAPAGRCAVAVILALKDGGGRFIVRVGELMTRKVATCGPDDTLDRAAQLMWDNDCGCIPVCVLNDAVRPIGIITDRDVCMSALFHGSRLSQLRVRDAMSRSVWSCGPGNSIMEAERIMREAKIRRIPVVDANGALVGLISLADLAREADREQTSPTQTLTGDEVGVTLARICATRIDQPFDSS